MEYFILRTSFVFASLPLASRYHVNHGVTDRYYTLQIAGPAEVIFGTVKILKKLTGPILAKPKQKKFLLGKIFGLSHAQP